MNIKRTNLLTLFIIAVALPAFGAAPQNAPTVTFGATSLTVSGITPKGTAIIFAAAWDPVPGAYMSKMVRFQTAISDDGGKGSVQFDLGRPVPRLSVWAVVDATTGHFTITAPPGYRVRTMRLPGDALRRGASAGDRFSFDGPWLDLLYVHPGLGAWVWHDVDGTTDDADGPNGRATVDVSQARSLLPGSSGHPQQFAPGGVLIAIDTTRLTIASSSTDTLLFGGAN